MTSLSWRRPDRHALGYLMNTFSACVTPLSAATLPYLSAPAWTLCALRIAGIRPHVITFADTDGKKPETIAHVDAMDEVLRRRHRSSVCKLEKAMR